MTRPDAAIICAALMACLPCVAEPPYAEDTSFSGVRLMADKDPFEVTPPDKARADKPARDEAAPEKPRDDKLVTGADALKHVAELKAAAAGSLTAEQHQTLSQLKAEVAAIDPFGPPTPAANGNTPTVANPTPTGEVPRHPVPGSDASPAVPPVGTPAGK